MDEAGAPVPEQWAATREARAGVDTEWIARFKDPTLTALVREALRENQDLKIAAARVAQARSEVKAARAQGLPQVNLGASGLRSKRNFIGFPFLDNLPAEPGAPQRTPAPAEERILSDISNTFGLTLDTQWELDLWGRVRAGTLAAAAGARAAEEDYHAARASLAAETARAWFALVEANAQTALAREALKVFQDTERALSERFMTGQAGDEGGLGAQLRLARSDVATARAALLQRQEEQSQAARRLELLLGRYPAGVKRESDKLPALPPAPGAGLPSELLQRRPDILAAERRFAARGLRQKEARRAVFPRLTLTASGGTSTDELRNLLNSDFGVWNLGGNVAQTIFTGGQVRAEINRRAAEEREALANLQKTVLRAFSEVENALEAETLLRQREEAMKEAVKLAEEADAEARADYRRGLGDILNVLATQNRLIQARGQLATLRRLRLDNRVALHLALGGDFSAH